MRDVEVSRSLFVLRKSKCASVSLQALRVRFASDEAETHLNLRQGEPEDDDRLALVVERKPAERNQPITSRSSLRLLKLTKRTSTRRSTQRT